MPQPSCQRRYPQSQRYHPRNRLRGMLMPLLLLLVTMAILLAGCGPSGQATPARPTQASDEHTFTYVAIGASDAFGIGTADPDRDNWPTVLADLLGPGVHLVNLGIPGETVAEARQTELPIALDADPALVTVWLGVNDIVQSIPIDEYQKQLEAMLLSLRQQTHARVYVANIPDLSLLPFFTGYDRAALKAEVIRWNAAIAQAVTASGASLVDIYASWTELAAHPEYIAGDGFHPSTEGAKRLAEVFQSWIAPALPALRAAAGIP